MHWRRRMFGRASTPLIIAVGVLVLAGAALGGSRANSVKTALSDVAAQTGSVAYWYTQPFYQSGGYVHTLSGYTVTPNIGYYPFPDPIACHLNFQNYGYAPNCMGWGPAMGGILSANILGGSSGVFAESKLAGGGGGCYPAFIYNFSGSKFGGVDLSLHDTPATSSVLYVNPGDQVEVDWSCQPLQYSSQYLACNNGWAYPGVNPIYQHAIAKDSFGATEQNAPWSVTVQQSDVQVSATASSADLIGSTTVRADWPQGTTRYFSLYCQKSDGTQQLQATVPIAYTPPPLPAVTITDTATGKSSASVTVGTPVSMLATFSAGTGDVLQKAAITDNTGQPCIAGVGCGAGESAAWTMQPLTARNYTFTPTVAGQYVFYPQVVTAYYTAPTSYNQSFVITATALCQNGTGSAGSCTACNTGYVLVGTAPNNSCQPVCPNGSGPAGSCTACNTGYVLQGKAPRNSCVAGTCSGAHQVNYPTCNCDVGYTLQGGSCKLVTCSDPHAVPPSCTTCVSGFTMQNGSCQVAPPTTSISAQTRVNSGDPTFLSWSAQGIGAGTSCSVSSTPAGVFSATMPAGTTGTWSGSNVQTGPITSSTTFSLWCTGSAPVSVTVTLIPQFKEI